MITSPIGGLRPTSEVTSIGSQSISSTISYEQHEPIVILSDSDFVQSGWPGFGTPDVPFVIENLRIESDETGIEIRNTRVHFVVRNCHVWLRLDSSPIPSSGRSAISLENVTNARIIDCALESSSRGVLIEDSNSFVLIGNVVSGYPTSSVVSYDPVSGVDLQDSANFTITDNSIIYWSNGLEMLRCNDTAIHNNTLAENKRGLRLRVSYQNLIINNTISQNELVGIRVSSSGNNSIYGNMIGQNGEGNAYDNDGLNFWDDGISFGNAWSDYQGTGEYVIPGGSSNVDRFPWSSENYNYSIIDILGPEMQYYLRRWVTRSIPLYVSIYNFFVTASDLSGVDTVLVFFRYADDSANSYREAEMQHTPSESNPDLYEFETATKNPYDGTLFFYYWANDSLGNERSTPNDHFGWHGSPAVTGPAGLVILAGIAVFAAAILLLGRKIRREGHESVSSRINGY
jgi:parallel beta-helix repeat protein